jgi:hypothetical protein
LSYLALAKATLARLRASSPADPKGLVQLLTMQFDVFASGGQPLEVRVPWWSDTFWFVPDVRHAEALGQEGIGRHRVWTARELDTLLHGFRYTLQDLTVITMVRQEFGGEVVTVRPRKGADGA